MVTGCWGLVKIKKANGKGPLRLKSPFSCITIFPATSNQQPATSNQQPATSNQQPAPRWQFRRSGIDQARKCFEPENKHPQ